MTSTGEPYPQLTLFAADTLANPSATPAVETEQTIQDTCGRVSPMPFAYFDQDLLCWKTLQGTFLSDLEMSKPIWPRSGTTHNGIAYQRQPSAPRTSATEYSLSLHETMEWTPTATANQMAPSMRQRNPGLRLWPTPTTKDRSQEPPNRKGGISLGTAARLWPTPVARDHKGVGMKGQLPTTVWQSEGSGSLNPEWVEWLMGFPIGWTDLED
jgi:hypothetical protein